MSYDKFLDVVQSMRAPTLQATSKKYATINAGYRRMLARQAGLKDDELDAALVDLTNAQRRKLFEANRRIIDLAAEADRLLVRAWLPRG